MSGSEHNDAFVLALSPETSKSVPQAPPEIAKPPRLTTRTNNSGGVQGGITNGTIIHFRVGFKPPATIGQAQQTVNFSGKEGVLEAKGRHDPCVSDPLSDRQLHLAIPGRVQDLVLGA